MLAWRYLAFLVFEPRSHRGRLDIDLARVDDLVLVAGGALDRPSLRLLDPAQLEVHLGAERADLDRLRLGLVAEAEAFSTAACVLIMLTTVPLGLSFAIGCWRGSTSCTVPRIAVLQAHTDRTAIRASALIVMTCLP